MNYTLGDFGGITYNDGDYHTPGQSGFAGMSYNEGDFHTPGTSGFGGFVDSTKKFVSDYQMPLLAVAILALGVMALKEDKRA
jgi:hypothetical protein